jgi:hypothetical protein
MPESYSETIAAKSGNYMQMNMWNFLSSHWAVSEV